MLTSLWTMQSSGLTSKIPDNFQTLLVILRVPGTHLKYSDTSMSVMMWLLKWCTALLNQNREGFEHLLQLVCCTHLVLLSEYFGWIPGTPRILEVSEVVWEFRSNLELSIIQREEHRGQV